ncbi:hypothetical protein JG559_00200 [Enterococcus faecalis]|uniref:Uncharacterized protein n=1 Tax=Enterococcus faecalis TaxID=1351 RepID=A0A974NYP8_ENTFL|nr:hypothetical protein JG559_00200 [Enterococcus faecalis]
MFRNVSGSQPDILGNTWEFLQSDLKSQPGDAKRRGRYDWRARFIKERTFLVAQFGSYLIATLLLLAGIFLMSMWDFQQIVDHFQSIQDRLSHVFGKITGATRRKKEAKRATKKEAKAAERQAKSEASRPTKKLQERERMEQAAPIA